MEYKTFSNNLPLDPFNVCKQCYEDLKDYDLELANLWVNVCSVSDRNTWIPIQGYDEIFCEAEEDSWLEVLEMCGYLVSHEVEDTLYVRANFDDCGSLKVFCSCAGSTLVWTDETAGD